MQVVLQYMYCNTACTPTLVLQYNLYSSTCTVELILYCNTSIAVQPCIAIQYCNTSCIAILVLELYWSKGHPSTVVAHVTLMIN